MIHHLLKLSVVHLEEIKVSKQVSVRIVYIFYFDWQIIIIYLFIYLFWRLYLALLRKSLTWFEYQRTAIQYDLNVSS